MLKFSRIFFTVVLMAFLLLPAGLVAQLQVATQDSTRQAAPDSVINRVPAQHSDSNQNAGSQPGIAAEDIVPWVFAFVMAILALIQYFKRRKLTIEKEQTAQHTRTAEEHFRSTLQRELGNIRLLGSPDIESISVDQLDVFVNLDISPTFRTEKHATIAHIRSRLATRYPAHLFTPA